MLHIFFCVKSDLVGIQKALGGRNETLVLLNHESFKDLIRLVACTRKGRKDFLTATGSIFGIKGWPGSSLYVKLFSEKIEHQHNLKLSPEVIMTIQ